MKASRLFMSVAAIAALVLPAAAGEKTKQEYLAIFLQGKKIGHARMAREVSPTHIKHTTAMNLELNRAGVSMRVTQESIMVETPKGKPLSFREVQMLGAMGQTIEGTVAGDGKVTVKVTSSGQTTTRTMQWPAGSLMAEGVRAKALKMGLKEGTTYKYKLFNPSSLSSLEGEVTVGAKKKVDLLGRIVELTEVTTTMGTIMGKMTTTTYVDDDMNALKTSVPVLGMKLELISCRKEVALSKNEPMDFFTRIFVASPVPLTKIHSAKSIAYHLAPKGTAKLRLPELDDQTVRPGKDGRLIVTIRPAKLPTGTALQYKGKDKAALAALKPTRFLQSDRKEILALARKAIGNAKDAGTAIRRIRDFVYSYIDKKTLSVGYATAVEVAGSRQGDCSEHAVLAAAMCRAVGIPTQIVSGVAYVKQFGRHKHIFGPHAWCRAYVGGRWYSFDATFPKGHDAGHIALACGDGDIEDFFQVLPTMGYFTIAKVVVEN